MTEDKALAIRPDATLTSGQILAGLRTVASVLAPDLTAEELQLFSMVAARCGLDPFARQVYAIKRKGRVTFQTGIDGYRSIAARTGLYDGQDAPEFGPIMSGHPEWVTVMVYRKGVTRGIAATAHWDEYVPAEGQDHMWRKMPRVMLAKVAEALALRKAFPYDPEHRQGIGADIYTADEMAQADRPERPRPAPAPTLAETARARAATVQDAPQAVEEAIVVSEPTPEPIEAQPPAACASASPYAPDCACVLDAGHPGNHRTAERESWQS